MSDLHFAMTSADPAEERDFPLGLSGFRFSDLNRQRRLAELDARFMAELEAARPELAERLRGYRGLAAGPAGADGLPALLTAGDTDLSTTLVAIGPLVGAFIARLLGLEAAAEELDGRARADRVIFDCRRLFLERRYFKAVPAPEEMAALDVTALEAGYRAVVAARLPRQEAAEDPERELALVALRLLDLEESGKGADAAAQAALQQEMDLVGGWARALAFHPALRERARGWTLFFRPGKLDFEELVRREHPDRSRPELFRGPADHRRCRDGFGLTAHPVSDRQGLSEMNYCILCHERKKDSCSRGFPEAGGTTAAGKVRRLEEAVRSAADAPGGNGGPRDNAGPGAGPVNPPHPEPIAFRRNPLDIPLSGCPLDEKISEAHSLKRDGHSIGALAMIMVDNPLCAGTGNRVCNDCMKGCIYQKQTPVNIPAAETNILQSVLRLPYGFEIYALLQRWNPLNVRRPFPLPYNGRNVLVVGMGPAGYTLAHYLLNEGFGVVGVEGLKVEPLAVDLKGERGRTPRPIKDIASITTPLDRRPIMGFGGVSEYGITVRWDKNLLDVNYLALARRKKFRLFDGVRFGGTLTLEDSWRLGFDHVALATGAGRPTLVSMKNNLLRGIRQANDFLMTLQGSGAYRRSSLTNLQVELPALVIGGGLTGVDTATELQAYYVVQVEKLLERWETLVAQRQEAEMRRLFDREEKASLDRWLEHGRAIRAERQEATQAGRAPDFARLVQAWGGVTLVYRKRVQDSPAYRLNHEELAEALEEGIQFAECLSPVEAHPGPNGEVAAVSFERQAVVDGKWRGTGEVMQLPARSVMVAAGTRPNVIYEGEHPGTFTMDARGEFYQGHRLVADPAADGGWRLEPITRPGEPGFFTSYRKFHHGRLKFVSFYGDNHPVYAGNVVKAMASAKHGFQQVRRLFERETASLDPLTQQKREDAWRDFSESIGEQLTSKVIDVLRLAPTIVEIVFHAPLAARHFRPGQFFRLQNYEKLATEVGGARMAMEGLALAGHWVDPERGLLSTIVMETSGSSRLCALLKPGEKVVLMGPSGTPTEIPTGQTVLLAGGGFGNAVLLSIAAALRSANNRVLYFAGYRRMEDAYKRSEIERASDTVVWCTDTMPALQARRGQDRAYTGNIANAIAAYGTGKLGAPPIPLNQVTRLLTVGSDAMMRSVAEARHGALSHSFAEGNQAYGCINSPMQCMMKEICAQCLHRQVDPATGKESFVFSCLNQSQLLDVVDFDHLAARLKQNSASEKLSGLWLDYILGQRLGEVR